jgi:hypothetical protein
MTNGATVPARRAAVGAGEGAGERRGRATAGAGRDVGGRVRVRKLSRWAFEQQPAAQHGRGLPMAAARSRSHRDLRVSVSSDCVKNLFHPRSDLLRRKVTLEQGSPAEEVPGKVEAPFLSHTPSGAPRKGSSDSLLSVASAIICRTMVHGQASPCGAAPLRPSASRSADTW